MSKVTKIDFLKNNSQCNRQINLSLFFLASLLNLTLINLYIVSKLKLFGCILVLLIDLVNKKKNHLR